MNIIDIVTTVLLQKESIIKQEKIDARKKEDSVKNKEAYHDAISAYQFQVNRYHTFMNYFSLFNGALLIAYCTLLTSTTTVTANTNFLLYKLENTYSFLLCMIAILGIVVSTIWLLSLIGNTAWMSSWMKIVEKYENKEKAIYSLVVIGKRNSNNGFVDDFYSTQNLTKIFIVVVILAWCIALLFVVKDYFDLCCSISCIIVAFAIFYCIKRKFKKLFYSDLSSKKME